LPPISAIFYDELGMFQAKSGKFPVVGCCRGSKALQISHLLPDRERIWRLWVSVLASQIPDLAGRRSIDHDFF
jgi:hypothetical protein